MIRSIWTIPTDAQLISPISTVATEDQHSDDAEEKDEENIAPPLYEDKELLIEKAEAKEDANEDEGVEEDMKAQEEEDVQDEDFGM